MVQARKSKSKKKKNSKKKQNSKNEAQATNEAEKEAVQPKRKVKRKLTQEEVQALINDRARTFTPTRVVIFFFTALLLTSIPIIYGLRVSNVEVPKLNFKNKNLYLIVLSPFVSAGIMAYCDCLAMQQQLVHVLHQSGKDVGDHASWLESACFCMFKNHSIYFIAMIFLVGYFFINSIPVVRFSIGGLSASLVVLAFYEKNK